MKIRNGFVSNSSSSSFIIRKDDISACQFQQIHNHLKLAREAVKEEKKNFGYVNDDQDAWSISETPLTVRGCTSMDNFDMRAFLTYLGISDDAIEWGDGWEDWCGIL